MSAYRHFLRLSDRTVAEHRLLFYRTRALKAARQQRRVQTSLAGKTLVLVFEKASTRTRLSFEAAMYQMGGHAITLDPTHSQMSRGEPIEDTARVVSRYADAIMFRTFGDDRLKAFANASSVPVINGLSDGAHPVQLLADLYTIEERLGEVAGRTVAYVGDASANMGRSWVEASSLFGFQLRIASPEGYRPPRAELDAAGSHVFLTADPKDAVQGAEVVVTDVWTSMGQEAETQKRLRDFAGFTVDATLVAQARPGAIVLHCLPAHRGEEITADVLEGPQSAVWDEAENRLHVQKALLEQMLLE